MHPEDEAVVAQIAGAWHDAEYPGDGNLSGDPRICCGEYGYVAEFFRGKHWRDVTLESLKEYEGPANACYAFMSGAALRFYLPSLMLIAIEEPLDGARSEWEASMTDVAVWALDPPRYRPELEEYEKTLTQRAGVMTRESRDRLRQWWDERMTGLTDAQVRAIATFLARIAVRRTDDDEQLRDALEYWSARTAAL